MSDVLAEYRIHSNSISGKSALNGRVQAVSSQLAAVSERRRVSRRPDLSFPRELLERYYLAKSIENMMDVAEEQLDAGEVPHFRLSVAGKLLELASIRPYSLDDEDRKFIRESLAKFRKIPSAANEKMLRDKQAWYIATLLKQRNLRAAARMTRLPLIVPIVGRLSDFIERRLKKRWRN